MNPSRRAAAVAVLLAIQFRLLLLNVGHSWDIDAFLYIGSRLAHGELLYLRDFETKLPLVQYLSFIAFSLGGIGAWRILTFILASGIYVLALPMIVARSPRGLTVDDKRLCTTAAVCVLILGYMLSGAESAVLLMPAGAFLFLSMALMHVGLRTDTGDLLAWLGSGAAAAVAASIRPNYVYSVPALAAVPLLASLIPAVRQSPYRAVRQSSFFSVAFVGVAALQFLPYFFVQGGVDALVGGISGLSRFSVARSWIVSLKVEAAFAPLLALIATSYAWLFVRLRRVRPEDERFVGHVVAVSAGAMLAMAGLEYQIVRQHCWPSYGIMFLPFVALIAAYAVAFEGGSRAHDARPAPPLESLLLFTAIVLIGLHVVHFAVRECRALAANPDRYRLSWRINERLGDPSLKAFLRMTKSTGLSFYVPYDTNCHWQLDEARIGDGHPAMFMAVMAGAFDTPIGAIPLYSDAVRKAPCLIFELSGKDLIVVPRNDTTTFADMLIRCLEAHRDEVGPAEILQGHALAPAMVEHLVEDYRFFRAR